MKRCLFLLTILSCLLTFSNAYISDDMKGVWVATVYNLDYPIKPTIDINTLKDETIKILDNISKLGFNAVFLQVRPSADAIYNSDIFPWSKYLTGENGKSPEGNFDPLRFWVEEAHKRGIEIHAWINPYRITKDGDKEYSLISNDSPAKKNPSYVVKYSDGNYYFDPGNPEVRKLVVNGAIEIVKNYDVNGLHMDDYFYPGTDFNDKDTYAKYGKQFSNINDWRRNNVDLLVQELDEAVHKANPNVSFGISPFGIWMNKSNNSLGSNTNGNETYTSHYADTRKWVMSGWLDYIAPQIYWEVGHKSADYLTLLNWWNDVAKNSSTKLYIGIADYKAIDVKSSSVWYKGKEIEKQIKLNDEKLNVSGEIHYRYSSIMDDKNIQSIIKKYYEDDDIVVFVNGNKVDFDQKPYIEKGRTLVPMRAIFEAIGANVTWDGEKKNILAKKDQDIVSLDIGSKKMKVNDKIKTIDVPAKLVNSRTMVPLRAISEAFNLTVNWYPETKSIVIND